MFVARKLSNAQLVSQIQSQVVAEPKLTALDI